MNMKLNNPIRRVFWGAESGSVLTEFVMSLPVFIMIFSGMGMLYQFNHEALIVKGKAYSELWKDDASTSLLGLVPIAGALSSVSSAGDIWQNGIGAAGIYMDSGLKAKVPATLMPGAGIDPKMSLTAITGGDDTMINYNLLNDRINPSMDTSGFAGMLASFVRTTGTSLALGAGVRYGAAQGEASVSKSSGVWGQIDYQSGILDVPRRSVATHRIMPIALTRFEIAATSERFDKSIPEFNTDMNTTGEDTTSADACGAATAAYKACVEGPEGSAAACESQQPTSACSGVAGSSPLGSLGVSL